MQRTLFDDLLLLVRAEKTHVAKKAKRRQNKLITLNSKQLAQQQKFFRFLQRNLNLLFRFQKQLNAFQKILFANI
jgi:hypothetical protein